MANSTFIQLTPYLLLEYIYGDSSTEYSVATVSPARLISEYSSNERTFLNTNANRFVTENVLDLTAAKLDGVEWVLLDRDVPSPYISQDSKLQYQDLTNITSAISIKYDTLKFHIQSGYNFEEIEGVVLQAYVKQAVSSNLAYLTSSTLLKGNDRIQFNPSPVFLTDRLYDRFVQILIPSVKSINDVYYNNPADKDSIGALLSTDENGLLLTSQIYIKAFEIDSVFKKNGNTFFRTNRTYETLVRQEDLYGSVAAIVREANDGDYFEYFPVNNGNFIEELILDLNSQGGNYVVVNQIDVIEQVGLSFLNTFSFTYVQNSGFNEPAVFRPILKYADIAPSFSIEYTARIYNTENAFQIVKKSSTTSYNPKKYGKNIEKIALSNVTSPLKVYNKVFTGQQINAIENPVVSQFNTVYVPVFYESRNLFLGMKNILAEGANPLDSNFSSDDIYFAQGSARIYLGDFDQYFKFSIRQYTSNTNSLSAVDLSTMNISLAFTDNEDKVFTILPLPSTVENLLSEGEIVFKVPSDTKKRMNLTGNTVKNFYLISQRENLAQNKMYSGTVQSDEYLRDETKRIQELGSDATSINELTLQPVIVPFNSTNPQINSTPVNNDRLLDELNKLNVKVSDNSSDIIFPPSIPGFTVDTVAETVSDIVPVSIQNKSKV